MLYDYSVSNNRKVITYSFHIGEDVCIEEESLALGLEFEHEILDHLASDRIESTHRFIKEYEFWVVEYRLCKTNALEHPLGVSIESFLFCMRKSHLLEYYIDTFLEVGNVHLIESSIEFEEFFCCEILIEIGILWHESYALLNRYIGW